MEYNQIGELNNDFRTCLHHLKTYGFTSSPRGQETKELLNYNITLANPRNRIINFYARGTNVKYLLGELFWYLSGEPTVDGIVPYSKFWGKLTDEQGEVNSNYGTRLFGVHSSMGVPSEKAIGTEGSLGKEDVKWTNQWQSTIELLSKDPDTRQAIQNIHMPFDRYTGNSDIPCTLNLHWFIRANKLDLIVQLRSNDIILGFTNDVFQFTMLQEMMLVNLKSKYPNLELGRYMHNANSMHVYEKHFSMMESIVLEEQAIELSMAPMDRADPEIVNNLIETERSWRQSGCDKTFNFHNLTSFNELTPYWQNLIKMCFNEDSSTIPAVFSMPHHEHTEESETNQDEAE